MVEVDEDGDTVFRRHVGEARAAWAVVRLDPLSSSAELDLIFCHIAYRRSGLAGQLLREVCEWADRNRWVLWLQPVGGGSDFEMTTPELAAWYGRHGFEPSRTRGSRYMHRYLRSETNGNQKSEAHQAG